MNNERERRMAMLRAALPYTAGQQRHALELLLQADTLVNTAYRGSTQSDLEACDMEARPEEMLLHIQEYCTPRESDLIQMILNFIKANRLFQSYREFTAAHAPSGPNPQGDVQAAGYSSRASTSPFSSLLQLFGGLAGSGSSGNLMEFLITQLPPEQKQLFEQLRNFSAADFSAGNFTGEPFTGETSDGNEFDRNPASETTPAFSTEGNQTEPMASPQ